MTLVSRILHSPKGDLLRSIMHGERKYSCLGGGKFSRAHAPQTSARDFTLLLGRPRRRCFANRKWSKSVGCVPGKEAMHVSSRSEIMLSIIRLGVVAHTCNPRTWNVEVGGSCDFKIILAYRAGPRLARLRESLSQEKQNNDIKTVHFF